MLSRSVGMHGHIRFSKKRVLVVVFGFWLCSTTLAEDFGQPLDKKFSVSVGAFITDHDTRIRLDTDAGPGTEVSLENDLGLDATTNIMRFDAAWRFS